MQRLQRELRREAEHLVHMSEEPHSLLDVAIYLGDDHVEAIGLNPKIGEALCNDLPLAFDGLADVVGEMCNGHGGNVDTAEDSFRTLAPPTAPRSQRGRIARSRSCAVRLARA